MRQYYEQGTHVVLIDTGHSYSGLCDMIHRKTHGQDGIYYTYTEEHPISFNPFYTDDYVFDVEKKDSIVTLLLTLWKGGVRETTECLVEGTARTKRSPRRNQASWAVPCRHTSA